MQQRRAMPEVPMKQLLLALLVVASQYGAASRAGAWAADPTGSATGLMQRLERTQWIGSGPKDAAHVVYVFTDTKCPFCNDLWKSLQQRPRDVQVRYIMVAVIAPESKAEAASILQSSNPAAALERQERRFGQDASSPEPTVSAATAETLDANQALMEALHIRGTPGLVYRDREGAAKVFAGAPDAHQLQTILATSAGSQR
jgi:thiol:disulfide interchange protein DsbG